MSNPEGETDNEEKVTEWEATQVTGDLRKFLDYVLVPNHKTGKDKIFIETLGFRPTPFPPEDYLLKTAFAKRLEEKTPRSPRFKNGNFTPGRE